MRGKRRWQEEWTQVLNNKLRKIKKNTKASRSRFENRECDIKLCSRRIGHTRITHECLMWGGGVIGRTVKTA